MTSETHPLEPTTLHVPVTKVTPGGAQIPSNSLMIPGFVLALITIGIIGYFGLGIHRRRHLDKKELVFRKLAKQHGLSGKEMREIYRQGMNSPSSTPIGILLSTHHQRSA